MGTNTHNGIDSRWWVAAAIYAVFFGLLLLPFPMAGELPGNCDTWLNGIALPNHLLNQIVAWFTGQAAGTSLYPALSPFGYGESALGTSAIFITFKLITGDDIVAYYFFIATILTLNSLGVFVLAGSYVRSPLIAGIAGLAFSASNYILGAIDSPHTSFFFLTFFCLFLCKRYLATKKRQTLIMAAMVGGLQVYFSAYLFLFQSVCVIALLVGHAIGTRARVDIRTILLCAIVFVGIATPFFCFYRATKNSGNFANPWEPTWLAELHSLDPADLLRTLENNRIYPFAQRIYVEDMARITRAMIEARVVQDADLNRPDSATVLGTRSEPHDVKYFVYTRRCAFLGFVLYVLAAMGLVTSPYRRELGLLYVVALVVSFGPMISIGNTTLPNALLPFYRWFEAAGVLRVPCRAFSFSVLAVVLMAATGLEWLGTRRVFKTQVARTALFLLVCATILIENIPVPLKSFSGSQLATPLPQVSRYFADQTGHAVLNLPSRIGGSLFHDSYDLFEWNRELIYMNHQTYHRQNVVNGVHGYFPRTRLEIQRTIDKLPTPQSFSELQQWGIEYIIYHHRLELPWEAGLYERIVSSGQLAEVSSSADVTILTWSPQSTEITLQKQSMHQPIE